MPFGKATREKENICVAGLLRCDRSLDGGHSAAAPAIEDDGQIFLGGKIPVGNPCFLLGYENGARYVPFSEFFYAPRVDYKDGFARGEHGMQLFRAQVPGTVEIAGGGYE